MMNEHEQDLPEFSLDEIIREFSNGETHEGPGASADELLEVVVAEALVAAENGEKQASAVPEEQGEIPGDTVRVDDLVQQLGDTQRISGEDLAMLRQAAEQRTTALEEPEEGPEIADASVAEVAEPFSEGWEPDYDQPIGEYIPPQPIVFHPRSRLKELKRKLVAGPEKRYYELSEVGLGKLQAAIFLSLIVVLMSSGALLLYALDMVQPNRMRLLVFGEVLAMLLAALLGSYQLMGGIAKLLRGRFTPDVLLFFTFAACCVDSVFCLKQLRVPYCAAFCLEVTMSLWAEYQRRNTELGQMDTMRKATRLDSVVKSPDIFDGRPGFLRGEGEVEDFMDNYAQPSGLEKNLSRYVLIAFLAALAIGITGGILHGIHQGIRLCTAALLAALPVTGFITLSRPMAVLERRLHRVGGVLCGWQGVKGLCGPATVPLRDEDLFPAGSVKMNGVKFFGSRDPDEVVAYATALISAEGGGLATLFNQLLDSRNGRHYEVENFQVYGSGGLGGEVNEEPVLIGTQAFLRDMGVELPEGTRVSQAVYVAVDGELCGVFAITYGKVRASAAGLSALCGYRSLTPVLTCGDFMLTESFLRSKFGVNTRRIAFPPQAVQGELAAKEPEPGAKALALTTRGELASFAFVITGARTLRSASIFGVIMHMIAGILGLAIVLVLGLIGAEELLSAENLMLFELIWLVPGLLISEWTRNA